MEPLERPTVDLEIESDATTSAASPISIDTPSGSNPTDHQDADNVSLKSTDAIVDTDKDDLNALNIETNQVTEHELNPELDKFLRACQEGNLTVVKDLISLGKIGANDTFSDNVTALHWACLNNRLSIVKYLCSNDHSKSDPNALGGDLKASPLHWAARNGLSYIVDYLLTETDADPSIRDVQSYNTLHLAVHSSNITLVILILLICCSEHSSKRLYVDEPDNYNRSSLHWAAYQGDLLSINALLKFGADVSKVDNTLFTPLHWGFVRGHKLVLKVLLEAGSDIYVKNDQGKNSFDVLKDMNCSATWNKVLRENGRDPKRNWQKSHKFLEPKVGKIITFFVPYVILPLIFQINSFSSGYAIPKLFLSGIIGYAAIYGVNTFIVPTYLISDKAMAKSPFLAGIFSASLFWVAVVWIGNHVRSLFFSNFIGVLTMGVFLFVIAWSFFKTMFINPGYVPTPTDNNIILAQVRDLINLGKYDTDNFCVNSFVRKPLRSKYSFTNSKLIARFDHTCPWVYNEIGVRNHKLFLTFTYSLNAAIFLFIYLTVQYFDKFEDGYASDSEENQCLFLSEELCYGYQNKHFQFNLILWCTFQLTWVLLLNVVQTFQIFKGLTTWEFTVLNSNFQRRFNHLTAPREFGSQDDQSGPSQPHSHDNGVEVLTKLLGIDQFVMTAQLSTSALMSKLTGRSTPSRISNDYTTLDVPTDFGLKQNWLDFWVLGDLHWRNVFFLPIEGENNLNGQLVDYYKLFDYPNSVGEIV